MISYFGQNTLPCKHRQYLSTRTASRLSYSTSLFVPFCLLRFRCPILPTDIHSIQYIQTMSSEQTASSQEAGNQPAQEPNEVTVDTSTSSSESTTSSFYCETAAEIEGRSRRPDPLSIAEWAKHSDEFEKPPPDSPTEAVDTGVEQINTVDHVDHLSPSTASPSKKGIRKITPPNPTLEASSEQFEAGPWGPENPPPTPIREPRTPDRKRVARKGTTI
jgi:hypothetical protein